MEIEITNKIHLIDLAGETSNNKYNVKPVLLISRHSLRQLYAGECQLTVKRPEYPLLTMAIRASE